MKLLSLQVQNLGPIADATIQIDKPLVCFFGEVRQGKTTLLHSFEWACGGAFPADVIRHGASEAFVGDAPAKVSEEVGVFVVEEGTVKQTDLFTK